MVGLSTLKPSDFSVRWQALLSEGNLKWPYRVWSLWAKQLYQNSKHLVHITFVQFVQLLSEWNCSISCNIWRKFIQNTCIFVLQPCKSLVVKSHIKNNRNQNRFTRIFIHSKYPGLYMQYFNISKERTFWSTL